MKNVNIYLNFEGSCEAAFGFYKDIFGAEYNTKMRYSEMPYTEGVTLTENDRNKILHVSLPLTENFTVMGCDVVKGMGAPVVAGNNFSVMLNTENREDADRFFNALGEGGQIVMPMGDTFWGAYFGMITDKFGINWMVSFEK